MLAGYTLREATRNRVRTLLTLTGVTIGVAALVAVGITLDTTRGAYRSLLETAGGKAALEVRSDSEAGLDPALARQVAAIGGVRAAAASVQATAALVTDGGPQPSLVVGIDPETGGAVRSLEVREGAAPQAADEVLLDAAFADTHGLSVGSAIEILAATGRRTFRIAGIFERGGAASLGGALTYMRLESAQELFGLIGRVTSIDVVLEDERQRDEVAAALRAALPAGTRVAAPAARAAVSHDAFLSTEQGLSGNSVLSLIAGAFIVLNTFLMNVGERRRQLALLRALGTTRRQLTLLLLRETLLLSLLGTILGVTIGIGGAYLLKAVLEPFFGLTLPGLELRPSVLVLAFVAGPSVALVATLVPARRAAGAPPLEHLTQRSRDRAEQVRGWTVALGVFLLLLLAPFEVGFVQGWLPGEWIAPGMAVLMVGAILLFPLLLSPLSWCTARLLGPLARESGRIAFRQLDRHRVRTSLTAGVFFVAVTVAIAVGMTMTNAVDDIEQWYERVLGWDHYVRGSMPDVALITPVAIPDEIGGELEAIEGVGGVGRIAFVATHVNDRPALLVARTIAPDQPLRIAVDSGSEDAVRAGLHRGEVVMGTYLAQRLGVATGDTVTLATGRGPVEARVAALATEYTVGGAALYLEWSRARELLGITHPHGYFLQDREGAVGVGARLERYCAGRKLLYQSNADMRRVLDTMKDGAIGLTWMLLALVFLVASLGAVNTLTMNVLEQTREFGLLRAVAMTRRQIGRVVGTQALALGMLGLLPGLGLGIVIGLMMNVAGRTLHGQIYPFHVTPALLIGCAVLTLLFSGLAGVLPARRAMRLRIFDALRYE